MARKRFTPDEITAYAVGTVVEYRNGGQHWHGATVVGPLEVDTVGYFVPVKITRSRGTLFAGDVIPAHPNSVRIPALVSA